MRIAIFRKNWGKKVLAFMSSKASENHKIIIADSTEFCYIYKNTGEEISVSGKKE
ncbi:MAG: hypothetical protein Q4F84_05200 [Fibrobacter sp.]|nr:hypothetical protein [Fibrobacter sp.]